MQIRNQFELIISSKDFFSSPVDHYTQVLGMILLVKGLPDIANTNACKMDSKY